MGPPGPQNAKEPAYPFGMGGLLAVCFARGCRARPWRGAGRVGTSDVRAARQFSALIQDEHPVTT
jgi:hypothetical protein